MPPKPAGFKTHYKKHISWQILAAKVRMEALNGYNVLPPTSHGILSGFRKNEV